MKTALDDARDAVHEADRLESPIALAGYPVRRAERDALRALIQYVGELEERVRELEGAAS